MVPTAAATGPRRHDRRSPRARFGGSHDYEYSDILGVPVVRPKVIETTALGAAYAAGIAVGYWDGEQDVIDNWDEDKRWEPTMDDETRERYMRLWNKAVERTFDWIDDDVEALQA
ncbi:sugar/nucleoside kinase (ribokinase family) [Brachybacterium muris]|nr:sugar/nucleoside kinase (ribokinase family) [Brachybacterium muris]